MVEKVAGLPKGGAEMTASSRSAVWIASLLEEDCESAWDRFLTEYAGLVLQVVRLFERDPDRVDDCFVFVCERLKRDRMRRIRHFDKDGPASFSTWLRAVVRNLCLDWRRKRFGRPRLYRSIARLPQLEQEVFRCIFLQGLSESEALHCVKVLHPSLDQLGLAECIDHIRSALTPRQSWLLSSHHPILQSLASSRIDAEDAAGEQAAVDRGPDPEQEAARREQLTALRDALQALPSRDRLLLRLRFEQELTLEQIARLTRIGSALKAQRALDKALAELRHRLCPEFEPDQMSLKVEPSLSVKDR